MKTRVASIFVLICAATLCGQTRKTVEDSNADLVITANVRGQVLNFEKVPNTNVEFSGTPERETVWDAERENLPKPVEPGVTYRNIGIRLRIASRFADIDRIVAEALGEVPVANAPATTDAAPANSLPLNNAQPRITNQPTAPALAPPR